MTTPHLLLADALITMASPEDFFPTQSGVAIHNDKIIATGTAEKLRQQFPDAPEQYLPGLITPGLVNAHTHLELGYQRDRAHEPPAYFTDWVTALMRNYPPPEEVEAKITQAVRDGVAESLRFGVTMLGDISRHSASTRRQLRAGPLRVVSFGEIIGLGKMRARADALLHEAANPAEANPFVHLGLSPHAPYTVEAATLRSVISRARQSKLPLTIHLSELHEERDLLKNFTGRLADWTVLKNIWDSQVESCDDGPIHWADSCGLFDLGPEIPVLLAHVNYCDDTDLKTLARPGVSVAYCPRTHAYFGHLQRQTGGDGSAERGGTGGSGMPIDMGSGSKTGHHRYREMLDSGINVCLGTDSLASNPDLSILREAALLSSRDQLPPYQAMQMITSNAARGLGLPGGLLQPHLPADLALFPITPHPTLTQTLSSLLRLSPSASALWIAGTRII